MPRQIRQMCPRISCHLKDLDDAVRRARREALRDVCTRCDSSGLVQFTVSQLTETKHTALSERSPSRSNRAGSHEFGLDARCQTSSASAQASPPSAQCVRSCLTDARGTQDTGITRVNPKSDEHNTQKKVARSARLEPETQAAFRLRDDAVITPASSSGHGTS